MKKITMFTAAGIIVFCIVPISATQAMPNNIKGENSLAPGRPNAVLPAVSQKKIRDMIVESNNPWCGDSILTSGLKVTHEKKTANHGRLMTARAHVHNDQQAHLKKAAEPPPYFIDDDNNDDKEARQNKEESAAEEKTSEPAEPVKEQEEEKDTIEKYN